MWADSPTLRLIAFSCLIGFTVFCASYSILVWRRRNRSAGNLEGNLFGRFRSWFVTSAMLGVLAMAVGFAVRDAVTTEGNVSSENVLTVRGNEDLVAYDVQKEGLVSEGDLLVRFRSPKLQGNIDEAQMKLQRLRAEEKGLPLMPLPLDSELIRRHQNAVSDKRTLQDSFDNVLTALESAIRDLKQQTFMKEESLTKVEGELKSNENELKQAESKRNIASSQLARERELELRGNIPGSEIDERKKEVANWSIEVEKLAAKTKNIEKQKVQLQEILVKLNTMSDSQTKVLRAEYDRIKRELDKSQTEAESLTKLLKDDESRARKLRESEIEQMALKVKEAEAIVGGFKQRLEVRAPFDGRVFYANPSGASATRDGAIMVVGPVDGFRLKVRVPAAQVEALRTATDITLDVGDAHLTRKLPATFRAASEIPSEPETMIAEMNINPSAEAVKVLAEESRMKAKLTWRFPLLTFWPFKVGLILFGLGVIGVVISNLMGREVASESAQPAKVSPKPTPKVQGALVELPVAATVPLGRPMGLPVVAATGIPVDMPFGETIIEPVAKQETEVPQEVPVSPSGDTVLVPNMRELLKRDPIVVGPAESSALLELLAGRLRESIHREYLEADVVESAEWALERHGNRALRVFRAVFREDNRYVPRMESLLNRLESPLLGDVTPMVAEQRDLARRAGRILEIIGARFISPVTVA